MKSLIRIGAAICLCFVATSANATGEEMKFRIAHNGGNCSPGCSWIVAHGEITSETPEEYRKFILENRAVPYVVVDSPGGDLFGGIMLGRIFREYGQYVYVGSSHRPVDWGPEYSATTEEIIAGECYSACAYALLGGTYRGVWDSSMYLGNPDSKLGFHQFYDNEEPQFRILKILNQEVPFSDDQLISGLIVNYLIEMGIDPRLVSLASSAGPLEMVSPNPNQLEEFKIERHLQSLFSAWVLEPYQNGLVMFSRKNPDDTVNNLEQVTAYCQDGKTWFLFTSRLAAFSGNELSRDSRFSSDVVRFGIDADLSGTKIFVSQDRIIENFTSSHHLARFALFPNELQAAIDATSFNFRFDIARVFGRHIADGKFETLDAQKFDVLTRNCI